MIAVSDGLNYVLFLRNFVEDQGYALPPAKFFQGNMSAITLIQTGKSGSSLRTRHIAVRFYFIIKDRIENREVEVVFNGTEEMIADILTKLLQDTKIKTLRS